MGSSISPDQVKALVADFDKSPSGVSGLTRGALAFTLLLIIGVAVFHLLIFGGDGVSGPVDKLLTLLTGAVTSITGFYFGGKLATDAATAAAQPSTITPAKPGGSISRVNPDHGKQGDVIEIEGKGFGPWGSVLFDKIGAEILNPWKESSIKVKVPAGLQSGKHVNITVNPVDGPAIVGAENLFKAD